MSDVLTGVVEPVEPELPEMPKRQEVEPERSPNFAVAIDAVESSLSAVRRRLEELRDQRLEINDEIRGLVAEEGVLNSMARIARKKLDDE